jgi:formiminoglutamase
LRAALAAYGTPWDAEAERPLDVRVFDAGDVIPAAGEGEARLFATHARVEEAVRELHDRGLLPMCIGGGHDLSLPSISALSKHVGAPVGGINFDAHLDVRTRVGSGMPFRRLIEGGFVDPAHFVEFGVGRFVNDESDCAWLTTRGATLISAARAQRDGLGFEALQAVAYAGGPGFLSVDLDGLDGAVMASVSALNPAGLQVPLLASLAEAAGADARVRHFDIMELAPELDASGRGIRIAAHVLLCFVAGFVGRRT